MPPQGESAGLALEDVILLSGILKNHEVVSVERMFLHYDELRRPRINAAVKFANFGFETIKDCGWLKIIIIEWMTWLFLILTASRKEKEFAYDVRSVALGIN